MVSRAREDAGMDELTGIGYGDEGRSERTRLEGSSPPAPSQSYDAQREVESLLSCPLTTHCGPGSSGGTELGKPMSS